MPDAILLDGNLANMSGVEFLRTLRREAGGSKPVVVLCTSENDVANITEAVGAGANDYLVKPFDRELVEATFVEVGLLS
jgi:two-component system chemotaxis response regulator CheY